MKRNVASLIFCLLYCITGQPFEASAQGPNLIANGGFEDGTSYWAFWTNGSGDFSTGTPSYAGSESGIVTIWAAGTNMQLYQAGMSMQGNTQYRLTFAAKSNTGRDMFVQLLKHTDPWTQYGLGQTVELGTSWQTYQIDFWTQNFSGSSTDIRFRFWFADHAQADDVYYIDEVCLAVLSPDTTVPDPPQLTWPGDGATGIPPDPTLTWDASAGAASYGLQVSITSGFGTTVVDESGITGTSYGLSGLVHNTTYYWRVNATDPGGTSDWSTVRSFTVHVDPPASPALALPTDGATGVSQAPTLSWQASTGATSYAVQVSTQSSFSTTVYDQSGITGTSSSVSGLSAVTTYYWRVRASNSGGTSAWSSVYDFTTGAPAANILGNGGFESGTSPWWWWDPSFGSFSLGSPAPDGESYGGLINIWTASGQNLQFSQNDITLETSTEYKVKFSAYSNSGRDAGVYVHNHVSPYSNCGLWEIPDLGTSWNDYEFTFETPSAFDEPLLEGEPITNARFRFWFVGHAEDGDVYHFDNVSLVETAPDSSQPPPPLVVAVVTPDRTQFVDDEPVLFDGQDSGGDITEFRWFVDDVLVSNEPTMLDYFPLSVGEASREVDVRLEVEDSEGREDQKTVTIHIKRRPRSYFYLTDHLGSIRSTVRGGEQMMFDDFETESFFGLWELPQWTANYGSGFRLYQGRLTHESASQSLLLNSSTKQFSDGIVAVDVQLNGTGATGSLVIRHDGAFYYAVAVYPDHLEIREVGPWYSTVKATHNLTTPVVSGQTYPLKVTTEAAKITVDWGEETFYWEDSESPILSGKIGFYHPGGGPLYGTRWDNIVVTSGIPGQVIIAEDYDPWGLILEGRSYVYGDPDTRYKFTGKERDLETGGDGNQGYDYFGARYYDARIARWMSVDQLGEKYPSYSPYSYATNKPTIATDPDGRDVLIRLHGDVARMVRNVDRGERSYERWDGVYPYDAGRQFAVYKMDVEDYGNQSLQDLAHVGMAIVMDAPQTSTFEAGRDAWYSEYAHSEVRFGKNNETPPGFYEVTDRTQESAPTKGKARGWLGINDLGMTGGNISGKDGSRVGISIHPGNPNFAIGCITMDARAYAELRKVVLRALNNEQKVYMIIEGRRAYYNSSRERWEYEDKE